MPDWLDSWTNARYLNQQDLAKRWAGEAPDVWPWLNDLLRWNYRNSTPEVREHRRCLGFRSDGTVK